MSNTYQDRRERRELLQKQQGIQVDYRPEYKITAFSFEEKTRVCRIEIVETKWHRNIIKYVTQNGVRHPIYGQPVPKKKTIRKNLKLTNEALECLNKHSDQLIRLFANEIVERMNCFDLRPSWYILHLIAKQEKTETNTIAEDYQKRIHESKIALSDEQERISSSKRELELNSALIRTRQREIERLEGKITHAKAVKHFILFSILSFGIYGILHSKRRIDRLEKKRNLVLEALGAAMDKESKKMKAIQNGEVFIAQTRKKIGELETEKDHALLDAWQKYKEKKEMVKPLPTNPFASPESEFVPLKEFSGMNYKKIVGCYVIRNRSNGKCYAGQSKDVMKRINQQHFKGTEPKNIIFAEDYYSCPVPDRADLFEVRMIPCTTRNELDTTEAQLIEEYDCFRNGYNSTSGNS